MKNRLFKLGVVFLFCLFIFATNLNAKNSGFEGIKGHWVGFIGTESEPFNIEFDFNAGPTLSITSNIPEQNLWFLAMDNVIYDSPKIYWEFKENEKTIDVFEGIVDKEVINGTFTKSSLVLNFTLKRVSRKPQTSATYNDHINFGKFSFPNSKLYQNIKDNRIPNYDLTDKNKIEARFRSLLYKYNDFNDELPTHELDLPKANLNSISVPTFLSTDAAVKEVDFLFKVIKYEYAGYQYFGGDLAFQKAKVNILDEIHHTSAEAQITLEKYLTFLTKNLDFIQDGHFHIGEISFRKVYRYFSTDKCIFHKDRKGIYTDIANKRHYLINVNEQDPSSFIKLSLNKKGTFFYQLGVVSNCPESQMIITYTFDNHFTAQAVLEVQRSTEIPGLTYQYREISGIPIIESRSLNPTPANKEMLAELVSNTEKLRKHKVIILDLRSNSGGFSSFASRWCTNLTGITPELRMVLINLTTNTASKLHMNTIEASTDESTIQGIKKFREELRATTNMAFLGWSQLSYSEGRKIHNKNFIIVLMDPYAGSAAEDFIRDLRQMDNVLFIGSNTYGACLAGNVGSCQLPYSKLPVSMGTNLQFEPDFLNRDGMGYLPDVWVNPEQALNYAVEFVKKNF